jgi:hypothetical protein
MEHRVQASRNSWQHFGCKNKEVTDGRSCGVARGYAHSEAVAKEKEYAINNSSREKKKIMNSYSRWLLEIWQPDVTCTCLVLYMRDK